MRKILIFSVMIVITGMFLYSCKNEKPYKEGMSVAAKWTDSNYYLATIKSIAGDKYSVDYADGAKGEVKVADLKLISKKEELKNGDKVLAVWSGAKFYSGKIKEMKETGALIIWDDGSAETEVPFGKIMKVQ